MKDEMIRLLNEQGEQFEQFRKSNEERLARLEAERTQLAATIRDLETRAARIPAGGNRPASTDDAEDAAAFLRYVRTGGRGEAPRYKGLDATTAANGAITIPTTLASDIAKVAATFNPISGIVSRVKAGNASFNIPVITTVAATQWTADTGTRSATATPNFTNIQPPSGELNAVASVSNFLLDDSDFDIQAWLVQELGRAFGVAEAAAFTNGTGTNQPKGITAYTINASPSFGQVGYVPSGGASTITADSLISLVYGIPAAYRAPGRASWLMAPSALAAVRTLKDSQNQYLFAPGLAGQPASLLGFPLYECADLPVVAANAYPVWFGDFARFYTAIDVGQPRIILDPFTSKGSLVVYMARRVGGCVVDSTAVKTLKVATS